MIPCPYCESENVIRIAPLVLEYMCIDCRETWTDYIDMDEW